MAAKKTRTKTDGGARATPRRRAPRKAKAESTGLEPSQCSSDVSSSPALQPVAERVQHEGGVVIGSYREPYGGHPLLLAVLPVSRVEPTPFQRDLSDVHHKRLADVVAKTGRFLDPIIVITAPDEGFWTPNGRHRLEAMRRLGARAITALVVPDREVAWQILALNTERAHNMKERSTEVIRIYRDLLARDASQKESSVAFYLEDPALVTLGVCYERQPRFAGGAYHPVLRRTEHFSDESLAIALRAHEQLADLVLELEEKVVAAVTALRARGLTSPYLRSFVVSRINPLRWIKGDVPPAAKVVAQMRDRAARFNVERVRQEDLARMAGGPPDEEAG